ncbi:cytochrome P450 [Streptomyces sp. CRN 30]|uniref:cytochrome P450 n=1 Tax=Streptomyces sp. CRN 30 TaxID=3075613 RepID=UPI002A831F19|nr:cytochrome P450 [Streptomyces sp. CRN 30]
MTARTAPGHDAAGEPVRAGPVSSLRFVLTHSLPLLVKGGVTKRPRTVALLVAVRQHRWSAATLRSLRDRHGGAPVLVRGRSGGMLVLFDPADVQRFFAEPVARLALDAGAKARMLSVMEPTGVICTHGPLREARRALNEHALAHDRDTHPCGAAFLSVIREESAPLTRGPRLTHPELARAVERIARRCVLGDAAADDEELHGWLRSLRRRANWGTVRRPGPATAQLYARATVRLHEYAAHAPPYTLTGRALAQPCAEEIDPVGQAHHWLLAIDSLAYAAVTTLALLAARPAEQQAVYEESLAGRDSRLRACVQEALRLYPPVSDLVRVLRADTEWRGVCRPAGTQVLVPIGFLQRDSSRVADGDRFVPGRWSAEGADRDTRTAPFSQGGGRCPGDRSALLITTALCDQVLRACRITGSRPALDPHRPLPGALSPTGIRLTLAPR